MRCSCQVRLSDLVLESHRTLGLDIPHNDDSALWIVSELDREAGRGLWRLRNALLAVNVSVWKEGYLARGVGAWEVESCRATLLPAVRAEDSGSTLAAEVAGIVLELIVSEEEVVQLPRRVVLFLAFLHFLGPHRTIYVHELIDLERNQAACDCSFAIEATEQALEELLRVPDQHIFFLAELDLRCYRIRLAHRGWLGITSLDDLSCRILDSRD